MKQEVFNRERQDIASFSPDAIINEIDNTLVMDIPVQATDGASTFQFRAVWDETENGEVAGIRVYALTPNFIEIKKALLDCGVRDDQVECLFQRDSAGNHLMETCRAKGGGLAVAFATAYLTLVGQFAEKGTIEQLVENRLNWGQLLPVFGVTSCGYQLSRSHTSPAGTESGDQ